MSNNCKAMCVDREDRSYEPASVLLARIKTVRESKVASERVRRSQRQQKSMDPDPDPKIYPR
jgi:hypothetical protein